MTDTRGIRTKVLMEKKPAAAAAAGVESQATPQPSAPAWLGAFNKRSIRGLYPAEIAAGGLTPHDR